ncbi:MAG TPA: hypothetical protein VFT45_11690 [Longimicrobium sp.]|nr:hypothetical protein [Longimicrobium sp.]
MQQIASDSHRAFFLRVLEAGEDPAPAFAGEPYPALVWATRRTSDEEKQRIAQALIASGCRYVVCAGVESAAWENAADRAFIEQDLPEPLYDEHFVMTTSHSGQPVDDIAFFFVHNTNFDEHDFTRYLVLMIGADEEV